jgi:hypothetical protein
LAAPLLSLSAMIPLENIVNCWMSAGGGADEAFSCFVLGRT